MWYKYIYIYICDRYIHTFPRIPSHIPIVFANIVPRRSRGTIFAKTMGICDGVLGKVCIYVTYTTLLRVFQEICHQDACKQTTMLFSKA